ncbi:MAG: GldG family protein [Spirochaetaceae bacterium]|jgi:ABC-type uncharacterized transport system involved in gliding motility auxiliary subunit|nr:GldG family protein [Spirochaetaceae bacterium]
MNKKQTVVIMALSLAVMALVLLLSARLWFRVDLSENKSWSISPVSKNISDELPDQVRISYFVSDKLKSLYPFPAEIADIVNEYVSYSSGKISFTERDPSKENLEEKMQELGFPAQRIRSMEKDQTSFINVYSGILIEYEDRMDVIPFVFKTDTLEYDLTSRILALAREKEKLLGVIVGDSTKTLEGEYQYMRQYLTQAGYKLRAIPLDGEIPDAIAGLMVLGGAGVIDDWMLYKIDRYIQLGGKAFFALNSIDIDMSSGARAVPLEDKGLLAMAASYGAALESALSLDRVALPIVTDQSFFPVTYPFYIHVLAENGNAEHPITSRFAGADLYWANPLRIRDAEGVKAEPLFTTSDQAWLKTKDFNLDPRQAYSFTSEADGTRGVKTLAAALSGEFPSYWRGKPKPVREGAAEELPPLPEEAAPSRIVVVGNAGAGFDFSMGNIDFLNNSFAAEQPNLQFLVQCADWLSNDDDILSIRSRAPFTGRLDKIIDEGERLAAYALARIFCVFAMPFLVLSLGVALSVRRRRLAKARKEAE